MDNSTDTALTIVDTPNETVPLVPVKQDNSNISRLDFPYDFVFGSGTSAYQVEGAAFIGGKSLSVWDEFTLTDPGRIHDGSNGNVACDSYHKFKEDLKIMRKMGFDAYRFSLSWTRILSGGRVSTGINQEGIDYYNEVIDTIIANGMKPYATLFHWDLPYCLEKEYDGFLSKKIVNDFREYAELCFWEFGDRVKWWTTINEPWTYAVHGYVRGAFPPGKVAAPPNRVLKNLPAYKSVQDEEHTVPITRSYSDVKYDKSEPAKDAYTVGRNLLLAHSAAVHSYRTKFQYQEGQIGIVLCSNWNEPLDPKSEADKAAATRAIDFMLGWFLDPVLYGRYPQNMIDYVPPENLAPFSHTESQMLTGSIDFVGFNFYTAGYASDAPDLEGVGYDADQKVEFSTKRHGIPIGEPSGSSWLYIVPWALHSHLMYLMNNYKDAPLPPIYVTENGVSDANDITKTVKQASSDSRRVKYHQDHLASMLQAMNDGVDVRGYFAWSFCDNFEWVEGYNHYKKIQF